MNETPEVTQTLRFDPIEFAVSRPLATPKELAVAFGSLIDSIGDLTSTTVDRIITPGLSAITISWATATVPSDEWLEDVESQLQAFGVCSGVKVNFRHH